MWWITHQSKIVFTTLEILGFYVMRCRSSFIKIDPRWFIPWHHSFSTECVYGPLNVLSTPYWNWIDGFKATSFITRGLGPLYSRQSYKNYYDKNSTISAHICPSTIPLLEFHFKLHFKLHFIMFSSLDHIWLFWNPL